MQSPPTAQRKQEALKDVIQVHERGEANRHRHRSAGASSAVLIITLALVRVAASAASAQQISTLKSHCALAQASAPK